MSTSLTLACLWAVVATLIAMIPSRHNHWPQAAVLIAVGIPLLGYVTYENGPLAGLVVFVAGASILRWPLFYLWRWSRRQTGGDRSPPVEMADRRPDA
ncbi:DUF2484 family protein [Tropicimonas isoalkanivorans]|uniref:DUF2484 family protein n=1 Tax=Tropicimonas isoalkanivorans TaxID=441112 RepID=A0A1I1G5E9_9RHOB|nr:DUF2484 family protein [Tropicimonas isoalkanivorans]SFC06552.1 Protein of unknown function [Tropicimonas isoalkanivorans]